jgi:predicted  nucleic acid-binding Zn-ribbon protein
MQSSSFYSFVIAGILLVAAPSAQALEITVNGDSADAEEIRQKVDEKRSEVKETVRETQCQTLEKRQTFTVSRLEDRMNRIENRIENRKTRTEEQRKDADNATDEIREESQDRREDVYRNLEDIAETNEQRQAIDTFIQTNEAAVAKRENAINKARDDYRKEMDAIVADYEADVLKPYERYVAAAEGAIDTAISQCQIGTELAKLHADLRKNLSEAGQQFRSERANTTTDAQAQRRDAQQAYRSDVDNALDEYEETLQNALEELQDVLDIDSITITIEL